MSHCYCKKCLDQSRRILAGAIICKLREMGHETPIDEDASVSDTLLAVFRALHSMDEELDSLKHRLDKYENPDTTP